MAIGLMGILALIVYDEFAMANAHELDEKHHRFVTSMTGV